MKSTNPRDVAYLCRAYVRSIHQKAHPADPYFLKISITCGKIEQWTEHHYPSLIDVITLSPAGPGENSRTTARISPDQTDARLRILNREVKIHELEKKDGVAPRALAKVPQEELPKEFYFVVFGGFFATTLLGVGMVYFFIWLSGDGSGI